MIWRSVGCYANIATSFTKIHNNFACAIEAAKLEITARRK
jgi:hypothetical protein